MGKRMYAIARELKTDCRSLIRMARKFGMDFRSHMSVVSDAEEMHIKRAFKVETQPARPPVARVVDKTTVTKAARTGAAGAGTGAAGGGGGAAGGGAATAAKAPPTTRLPHSDKPIEIHRSSITFAPAPAAPGAGDGRGGTGTLDRSKRRPGREGEPGAGAGAGAGAATGDRSRRGKGKGKGRSGIEKIEFISAQRGGDRGRSAAGGRGGRGGGRGGRGGGTAAVAPVKITEAVVELPVTVKDLSAAFGIKANAIVQSLFKQGKMTRINDYLSRDDVEELALEFEIDVTFKEGRVAGEDRETQLLQALQEAQDEKADSDDLQVRPPVVTVLGHVDHGKTSLLDRIRETDVASGEAGGITQHIGASLVTLPDGRQITFIDTPGHEAFTEMRARGAQVTDIVILVVAADDGVMPTTKEAIAHARAANVPIIVALNKCDKPDANPTRVKGELANEGLVPTGDWGGDTEVVETGAHPSRPQGIEDLLDTVLLQAEIMELRANPNKPARGTVIEAEKDPEKGVSVTVLVQEGTLHIGDHAFAGVGHGKIRQITDDKGLPLREVHPSMPARILGLDEAPTPGDKFYVANDPAKIRQLTEAIRDKMRTRHLEKQRTQIRSGADLLRGIVVGQTAEVAVVVKADTQGSCEVLERTLTKLSTDEVRVRILHAAAGGITESDVLLAESMLRQEKPTLVIGFHVIADHKALQRAEESDIPVETFRVIYELEDYIRNVMRGQLKPEKVEVELGRAELRQVFHSSRVGAIAGCYVTKGTINRSSRVRLYRNGVEISPEAGYELSSLKRFKDDVREVREGMECGLTISGVNDLEERDEIVAFQIEERERTLTF